jgi:RNA polymerase sigma-70 factor, ECF subfamily
MPADESLLQRLKEGEATAYEWLVGRFEGPLFRFFVCDHRDFHLAQEQTSETFAQLVRSLPAMTGTPGQLPGFVFSIARHIRSRHWRRPSLPHSPYGTAADVCDPHPSPAAQADNREQVERMLSALAGLDLPLREILFFRFIEGASLDEVAELTNLPLGTVKSHIHRGVAKLKSLLADSGCLP